jgi:hypothetical protein
VPIVCPRPRQSLPPIPQPRRHRQPFPQSRRKRWRHSDDHQSASPVLPITPSNLNQSLASPKTRLDFPGHLGFYFPASRNTSVLPAPSESTLSRNLRSWRSILVAILQYCGTRPSVWRQLALYPFSATTCAQHHFLLDPAVPPTHCGSPTDTLTHSTIPDKASGPIPRHLLQPWRDSFLVAPALLSAESRFFPRPRLLHPHISLLRLRFSPRYRRFASSPARFTLSQLFSPLFCLFCSWIELARLTSSLRGVSWPSRRPRSNPTRLHPPLSAR